MLLDVLLLELVSQPEIISGFQGNRDGTDTRARSAAGDIDVSNPVEIPPAEGYLDGFARLRAGGIDIGNVRGVALLRGGGKRK